MSQPLDLEAYEDLLRKAALATGEVRDRVDTVLTTLQGALSGRGAPWGDDQIGDQFTQGEDGYFETRKDFFESLTNIRTTFANFSTGQTEAADKLEAQELANRDTFR
ncbi:hypothetical protein [Nocardia sp. CC227C]|uniref:hypothetical protein n=1 Tax=Nocardia sp. CC227C TaxID=3044562 RepID=UPI00278C37BB|nr:hypothetical protein [Nocardia sp. CC227C]